VVSLAIIIGIVTQQPTGAYTVALISGAPQTLEYSIVEDSVLTMHNALQHQMVVFIVIQIHFSAPSHMIMEHSHDVE